MTKYQRDYNEVLKFAAPQRDPGGVRPPIPNQSNWENPHAEAVKEIAKWHGSERDGFTYKAATGRSPLFIPMHKGHIVFSISHNTTPGAVVPHLVNVFTMRSGKPNSDGSTLEFKGGHMHPTYAREVADKLPPDDAAKAHDYLDQHFGPRS